jgi:dihydrofolate reductase
MLAPLALMVAMSSPTRVIGNNGQLPWHHPEDLQHFKRTTAGHAIIMGRKTADSLNRKPLPKRRNIVVTRQRDLLIPGFEIFADLSAAISSARSTDAMPFIIGGGELYAAAMPFVTTMYITLVNEAVSGDAFFPAFDEREWTIAEERVSGVLNFRTLTRK